MSAVISPQPRSPVPVSDGLTLIGAFMLLAAGLAHLSAAPAHFAEWWLFGVLFLLAAALQVGLAVALVRRPSRAVLASAVTVSLGLVVTWVWSRTSGLPFGLEAGGTEGLGALDVLTTGEEIMLIALAGLAAAGRSRRLVLACEASGIGLGVVLTLAFAGGVGHG